MDKDERGVKRQSDYLHDLRESELRSSTWRSQLGPCAILADTLTLCLPPTPGFSIVKRPHNEGLFSTGALFRSLGYRNQYIVVPADFQRQSFSVLINLKEDPTVLPEVRVFPYATEQEFKRAFLALKLCMRLSNNHIILLQLFS